MLTAQLLDKDGNVLGVESVSEPRVVVHFVEPKLGHAVSVVLKREDGAVVCSCPADAVVSEPNQVVSAELTLALKD